MGRKKANIDWGKVDQMLMAGCNGVEVAASIGIHPDTLYLRCEEDNNMGFSQYSAAKKASGDRLLKMKQFDLAVKGDRTMLVWLGKQRLGQSDKKTSDITTGGKPFTGFHFLPGSEDNKEDE
jgi:hypothetical protein